MVSHVGSRYVFFMSEIRIPAPREGRPQVKADIPSLVAEFLGELTLGDIIVELVQNELDGGSRRTEVEITDDALICTGDGEKIGPTGWERLSFVIGAGTLVEAKVDGIGVKNHGIRACFLLGDRIVVQSDKQRADLTARGQPDEPDAFFPAAWDPEPDPMAPKRGVRVTVPMRTEPLAIPGRNPLMPPTSGTLDELFNSAIEAAPDRFLCASTPGQPWRYELVFKRGKRTVSLTYTARSMGKSGLYERICTLAIGNRDGREVARRLTCPFVYLLAERDTAKVPRLFRDTGEVLGEICWRTNPDGWPMPGGGALRYPIAFPTEHVRSCWGFDISGPFVAGRARHSVGEDARNADIIATARRSFVELMRSHLVPRYGPAAVELALNIDHPDAVASNKLVAELVGAGALPLANDRPALKGVPANDSFQLIDAGKPLALPIARYAGGQLDAEIAKISRSFRDTLHQDVTPAIVRYLCAAPNSAEQTPEFDEVDAARSIFIENAPAVGTQNPEWLKRCVSVTRILERSRAHEKLTADELRTLKAAGRLPTDGCISVEWARMRRAKQLPPAIPGTKPPPILHSTLARSSIFREGAGAVERFNLNQYVANVDFAQAESKARAAFFKWLRRGHDSLQPKTLATLARFPIWPGSDGVYRPLDDYCWPSAEYLRRLLGEVQAAPAGQLLSFPGLRNASNASLRLRKTPKWAELTVCPRRNFDAGMVLDQHHLDSNDIPPFRLQQPGERLGEACSLSGRMPVEQVDAREQHISFRIRDDIGQVAEVGASPSFPAGHKCERPVRTALAELVPPPGNEQPHRDRRLEPENDVRQRPVAPAHLLQECVDDGGSLRDGVALDLRLQRLKVGAPPRLLSRLPDLRFLRIGRFERQFDLALADPRTQPLGHRHAEPKIRRPWMGSWSRHFATHFVPPFCTTGRLGSY